jgi:hypothetical protein
LIEDEFMERKLRAMKKWLEEIKNRFRQGRIEKEEKMRKKEEGKKVSVKIIRVSRREKGE